MQATFLSLKKGEEYTLTIKTLVNGQSVGKITEKFNTNKLKKLQVKELFEDKGNKMEEKETLAPQEEKEESKVEDECTYLEDIEEEKEEESQNITERVSLEVIDEKAKESASSEKVNRNRSSYFEIACRVL